MDELRLLVQRNEPKKRHHDFDSYRDQPLFRLALRAPPDQPLRNLRFARFVNGLARFAIVKWNRIFEKKTKL
jgi:hypothetical protein